MSKETIKNKFKNGMIPDENDFGELIDFAGRAEINAVPADKSITSNKIADEAVTDKLTTFLKPYKNLFNPDERELATFIQSDGSLIYSESYNVSSPVEVSSGERLSFTRARNIALYSRSGNLIEYIDNPGASTLSTTFNSDGYVRVSIQDVNLNVAQIERSDTVTDYSPYQRRIENLVVDGNEILNNTITGEKVIDGSLRENHMSFLTVGKNMYNNKNDTVNYYTNHNNGELVYYEGYRTSEYQEVKKGETYTISVARKFIIYDEEKKYVSGLDRSNTPYTFTAENDGYIRFSYDETVIGKAHQMEKGNAMTEYEPYGVMFPSLITESNKPTLEKRDLTVSKEGKNVNIKSDFDNQKIDILTTSGDNRNGVFNFISTKVNGQTIHSNNDDVTPIRTFNTVGANHGYTAARKINYAHDKTQSDLGSKWTDGEYEYTILSVESDGIVVIRKYELTNGAYIGANAVPSANLKHVSGAANSSDISIGNISAMQLLPSINNHSIKYILDNKEIENDGEHYGDELKVIEKYNIMSFKGLYDWATNNIGKSYANENVPAAQSLSIVYTFKKGGQCSITHSLKTLEKTNYAMSGFLQSIALGASGLSTHRYMPNVLPKDGFDFEKFVDMTNYNTTLRIDSTDLKNAQIPPSRYIDVLRDESNRKKYGFSMGYIIDKSNTKHADRLINTDTFWDLRNSKKSYPVAINNLQLEAGDYMVFNGFRNYIPESDMTGNVIINSVEDGNDIYIYIDCHETVNAESAEISKYIGRKLKVIESENFTLLSDVVNGDGVTFSVSNDYGYAILKVEL